MLGALPLVQYTMISVYMCARECSLISVCMHVSVEECGECVHSSSGCCVFQYFALVWHAGLFQARICTRSDT